MSKSRKLASSPPQWWGPAAARREWRALKSPVLFSFVEGLSAYTNSRYGGMADFGM
jgi:hypothetical protein